MSGVYPVSEQGPGGIEEGSRAETLLKYLGLPTTLKSEEDDAPATAQPDDAGIETDPSESIEEDDIGNQAKEEDSDLPGCRTSEMKID
jgi:hypothetical protein